MSAIRLAQLALLGSVWCLSMADVPIEAPTGVYYFNFLVCSVVEILCYVKIVGAWACMYPTRAFADSYIKSSSNRPLLKFIFLTNHYSERNDFFLNMCPLID